MLSNNELKAVCSVTEMAGKLGLSRARFYQLQKTGVFPAPVYCVRTKRPLYPLDLQQECLDTRKTGIGHNGQPIVFYAPRKKESRKLPNRQDPEHENYADTLKQMGLTVTPNKVKKAIGELYPDKLKKPLDEGDVIRDLFRYFSRRL